MVRQIGVFLLLSSLSHAQIIVDPGVPGSAPVDQSVSVSGLGLVGTTSPISIAVDFEGNESVIIRPGQAIVVWIDFDFPLSFEDEVVSICPCSFSLFDENAEVIPSLPVGEQLGQMNRASFSTYQAAGGALPSADTRQIYGFQLDISFELDPTAPPEVGNIESHGNLGLEFRGGGTVAVPEPSSFLYLLLITVLGCGVNRYRSRL